MESTRLIGLADAARELGVSVFTLRRLALAGELKTVTVGARRLVPLSEVERVVTTGAGKPRARKTTPHPAPTGRGSQKKRGRPA
jgi:excisionase family DNA binding protein